MTLYCSGRPAYANVKPRTDSHLDLNYIPVAKGHHRSNSLTSQAPATKPAWGSQAAVANLLGSSRRNKTLTSKAVSGTSPRCIIGGCRGMPNILSGGICASGNSARPLCGNRYGEVLTLRSGCTAVTAHLVKPHVFQLFCLYSNKSQVWLCTGPHQGQTAGQCIPGDNIGCCREAAI